MIKHKDSHLDHNLTDAQVAFILERFANRDAFFIETFELPSELGTIPCGLFGPLVGDAPISDDEVVLAKRGERTWNSRLVERAPRPSSTITVIAGPHDGNACVLYTAYAGPSAPQEPGDPGCKNVDASTAFWREHALAR
jgi:hypothetical protein